MPGFRPDAQKSGPRPPQRGGTSQPLHGTNNFFADLSKFFLTFADAALIIRLDKVSSLSNLYFFALFGAKGGEKPWD
jgi:hypothetical protein